MAGIIGLGELRPLRPARCRPVRQLTPSSGQPVIERTSPTTSSSDLRQHRRRHQHESDSRPVVPVQDGEAEAFDQEAPRLAGTSEGVGHCPVEAAYEALEIERSPAVMSATVSTSAVAAAS